MTAQVGDTPDYSFARRPKWIVSHLLVLALVVGMVVAGIWQINRHQERGERNDTVTLRQSEAPIDLFEIAPPGSEASVGDEQEFRRVVVTGRYQAGDQVLVRNRTLDGAPGMWVLTPLLTDDGSAVVVNRGWVPGNADDGSLYMPPAGSVSVVGTIHPTRTAQGFQVSDPAEGKLDSLARPDVLRIAEQVDYPLAPVVVRPEEANSADDLPILLALPELDAGPHLSYAGQWFIFTTIALVGYPLILRRVARGRADSLPEDEETSSRA